MVVSILSVSLNKLLSNNLSVNMTRNATELVREEGLSSLSNSYIDSIAQPFKIKGYCLLVQGAV